MLSPTKPITALLLLIAAAGTLNATEDLIWVDASINSHPERFILDTDSEAPLVLFRPEAEKLGLYITPSTVAARSELESGKVFASETKPCNLELFGGTFGNVRLSVVELPGHAKVDETGCVGWPAISAGGNILSFESVGNYEHVMFDKVVPRNVSGWLKLHLTSNPVLVLDVPDGRDRSVRVCVDTGDSRGVVLNSQKWREWKSAHPHRPTTVDATMLLTSEIVVKEEDWADEIHIGNLTLYNVPVIEGAATEFFPTSPKISVILGMAALRRLDLVVDTNQRIGYARPSKTAAFFYEHNRLGAVFAPRDLMSPDFVAHVAEDSPAYEGGVRNGDILLKIEKLDATV